MKLKVKDIYDLSLGLADLSGKELPISTALKVERNHKAVNEEVISTDKIRKKIAEKYKEKEVEGGIKIKEDKRDVFAKEIDELLEQGVDVNVTKISVDELGSISIKPKTLRMIRTITKDDAK